MKTIDYAKELNQAQHQAVISTEGPHLVIAGAGSGKTRVLVFRTAYLVEQGIPPQEILLLTFTRRAAKQMLERASQILDDRCQNVSGGTFHSFANATLRRYAATLGLSAQFTIMDESDSESAIQLIRTKLGLHKADKRFPKKGTLLSVISRSVNKCVDLETIIYDEYPHFAEWSEAIAKIKAEYERYKRDMSLLDYDDLLVYLRDLLKESEDVRQTLSRRYRYIMVDEYQDTNKIQAEIVRLLASTHENVMVVGDDSQSIYSFRGAHFKNIIDFPQDFPGTKVILLEENYRSSQPILDLTNEVIRYASERYAKVLFTNNTGSVLPVYVDVVTENDQSRYIVNKIEGLVNEGVPLNEIAILFRSGWHSNDLEVELASRRIPFLKYGGQKFVEAAHIKDLMSYLQVIFNPKQQLAWTRVLSLMPGIGLKGGQKIADEIARAGSVKGVNVEGLKSNHAKELIRLMSRLDMGELSPQELVRECFGFYYPYMMDEYDDYDKRLNDLDSLEKIAARYQSLEEFLTDMTLEPPEKNIVEKNRRARTGPGLVLSTIHSAKGLEWHTVFLIYVAEGYLPSYRSLESEEAIEEERRLFYVATTRAKQKLYLLRPQVDRSPYNGMDRSGAVYTRVSRFMGEGRILHKFVEVESEQIRKYVAWKDDF